MEHSRRSLPDQPGWAKAALQAWGDPRSCSLSTIPKERKMKLGKQPLMFVVLSVAVMFMLACTCGGISVLPDLSGGKATSTPSTGKGISASTATQPPVALPANAKAAILQSAAKLRDLKSYRMKSVIESGGNTMTTVQEVVAPNKVHLTTDYGEVIHFGDDM
jgi:hypothetical protein